MVPTEPLRLMHHVYRSVFPIVHAEIRLWEVRANQIENDELRSQALASLSDKSFHCEGGGVMALLSGEKKKEAISFIVAYQTISDYLDNLCDRSTSQDPDDFQALHESMLDALTVGAPVRSYYRYREDREEGYLSSLVKTCQDSLSRMEHYPEIKQSLLELCRFYCDLQVHKHVVESEREERLKDWFDQHQNSLPKMEWYEFSACTGSTLGIFCLVSYGYRPDFDSSTAITIRDSYFPYIQGLHILLDYLIDQEEDRAEGDLNFCEYYPDRKQLFARLQHFVREADRHTKKLPHQRFHRLINRGLLGVYLSDEKVSKQKDVRKLARQMIRRSGATSFFFYLNGRAYRGMQRFFPVLAGAGQKNDT